MSFVEDKLGLLLVQFAFLRLGNRSNEFRNSAIVCDILSWLPGVIEFPMPSWKFVGRIEYWSFEKFNAHTAQSLLLFIYVFGSWDGQI